MTNKLLKIFSSLIAVITMVGLSSCGSGSSDVTSTLTLGRSVKNKTFLEDGIEECEITKFTDGDTSNFRGINSGVTFTVRYLAIDTPESTAGYDKWGKAASVWNEKILSNVKSIILESEKSTPEFDTNGTRYLGFVWYMPKDSDVYRLYNLECVENGYSPNNCATNSKYYDYFVKAEKKAKEAKLHIHGQDNDPYYPEKITPVSLKELNTNASQYFDKENLYPTCVSFEAYVVNTGTGSFRTITVEQYDAESKAYYRYNVVVGYSGSRLYTIATQEGALLRFIGWTTGEGSIHGCQAMAGAKEDSYYTIRRAQVYYRSLNVKVSDAVVADGVLTLTGTAKINNVDTKVTLVLEDSSVTQAVADTYKGSTLTAKAFAIDANENKYKLNQLSDLTK